MVIYMEYMPVLCEEGPLGERERYDACAALYRGPAARCAGVEPELRWSLAHWFVSLRLSLKKDFSKWGFDAVKRA